MVIQRPSRQSRQPNPKLPLRIYLLAAVTSVVWVAGVVTVFFTQTVQADARLPRPIATMPPPPPALVEPTKASTKAPRHDLLHGMATWYGGSFNGRLTASGKPFNMFEMTACHPTLPFGSVVRVRNLRNNHSVVVSITDRGYLLEGRIIDLSFAAAEELNMTQAGVAPVSLEVIAFGPQRHRR
jgi:rare lipoprotein A